MTKKYITLQSEVVHQNPRWAYKHDQVQLPSGGASDYFYGEKAGGVIIVPVLTDGRLLLVRQERYLQGKQSVEFPRGAMGVSELPSEAATREFVEETGSNLDELVGLGVIESWNTSLRNPLHIFLATGVLAGSGQHVVDPDEEIEVMFRRVDEFEDMIRRGEIWDGITLAAWALAREHIYKLSHV